MNILRIPHPQQIFANLSQIPAQFKGVLLDAYGVFWAGNDAGLLPGSLEVMETLVKSGKIVGILSNSTQLVDKEVLKYHRHGIEKGKHFHFLLTSGEAARSIFLNKELPFPTLRHSYWVFGGHHPRYSSHHTLFQGTLYAETDHLEEADFIYIGVPHIEGEDQIDPEIFREEIKGLKTHNLPMVCANPDRFAHEGKPAKPVVRQGSIAALYDEMGGQVFYIGKPHLQGYLLAMKNFAEYNLYDPKEIVMVGDTPETDIRGARQFGMAAALVTQTGIIAERISHHGTEQVISRLSSQDRPDYFIERL